MCKLSFVLAPRFPQTPKIHIHSRMTSPRCSRPWPRRSRAVASAGRCRLGSPSPPTGRRCRSRTPGGSAGAVPSQLCDAGLPALAGRLRAHSIAEDPDTTLAENIGVTRSLARWRVARSNRLVGRRTQQQMLPQRVQQQRRRATLCVMPTRADGPNQSSPATGEGRARHLSGMAAYPQMLPLRGRQQRLLATPCAKPARVRGAAENSTDDEQWNSEASSDLLASATMACGLHADAVERRGGSASARGLPSRQKIWRRLSQIDVFHTMVIIRWRRHNPNMLEQAVLPAHRRCCCV